MTFHEFRSARRKLGLSASKLAAAIDSTLRTVQRWESGEVAIPGPVGVLMELLIGSMEARCALGLKAKLER